MEDMWTLYCGQSDCLKDGNGACHSRLEMISYPSSCANYLSMIVFDTLLLSMLLLGMICKIFCKKVEQSARSRPLSTLQIWTAILNGCLGLVYIGLGVWILEEKLRNVKSVLPSDEWVLFLFEGFIWLVIGLTASYGGTYVPKIPLRLFSVFTFLSKGYYCFVALSAILVDHDTTIKVVLDILSFLGASLLLLCTYKGYKNEESGETEIGSTLYTPLNGEGNGTSKIEYAVQLTPFAKAGLFSKMSFWWLNPLMMVGREKTLEEKEVPRLQDSDRAESCYLKFMDQLNKQKEDEQSSKSALLWSIIACNQREILISGSFALVSVLALSAGPLMLNAFIKVAESEEEFRYKGCVLAISLFFLKISESLSQRQWYFRSRLIGLKVRSLLTASIYRKQLRLSSASRIMHSGGEVMNYVTVDAYRIGEFCFWFHQNWTIGLQICIGVVILIHSVGLATIASLAVIILCMLCNIPIAKLLHEYQSKLMVTQDERMKACSEAVVNMKVLKFYAWETHFKNVIEELRKGEYKWLSKVLYTKACYCFLSWTSPILVSAATFGSCYFLEVPLHASNVFTFVATLRLVQDPLQAMTDVIGISIQAIVALTRIVRFLESPELQIENIRKKYNNSSTGHAIMMTSANLSWEMNPSKPTLRNITLYVRPGEKVAICGEVSSGKSTLLAAILGELPYMKGPVEVHGRIAYVSQTAWIQKGTIQENILFGSALDDQRYQETLRRCSLVKDIEQLPYGDMTEIGERGVNLSGGQKQRIQLARALYRDADIYLLDDPFSALDAQTASSLFREYVMEALSEKTVLLVTHQVDFLPAFHSCLLMSDGQILRAGPYHELLGSSREFLNLVNAHKETAGTERLAEIDPVERQNYPAKEINRTKVGKQENKPISGEQLIKQEERDVGDTGFKPYLLYLNQNKGYVYFLFIVVTHSLFAMGQILQNSWMATGVDNPHVSTPKLIVVYIIIGFCSSIFVVIRSLAVATLGMKSSKSLFCKLLNSLFQAPMSFYDATPLGRILSRVTADLSIVDLDIAFSFLAVLSPTINVCATLGVLAVITWQILFVSIPVIYMATRLQKYYIATAKELMRLNGTTKSLIANHLAETVAGGMTIRAFEEQDCFFAKSLDLVDTNASPFFHSFAANEWLIQRLETLNAMILSSAALCIVLLPPGTFSSGMIGMALSYGLSLNNSMVCSIQSQCLSANYIVSVERLSQYMHIPSEAPGVIKENRPPENWPSVGKVEISDLEIKYRPQAPLVLRGISCTFEGGDKIGIVGRTGSGKTTLIGALFRLVEPAGGKITVDGIDICSIGLHDLRSRFGIIPQEPTLFNGTVRFNLDPLCQHTDEEIWEVLRKCQLKESVNCKEHGLDSLVVEDGSNWSMGQRQLFCLGRALLRRSRVLVLDEATASIDNATDMVLQKTIRSEFSDCTVITVAHRIPTVMDCTKVLAVSDGKLVEYDEPLKLMKKEGSLFGQLVNEYWSHLHSAELH